MAHARHSYSFSVLRNSREFGCATATRRLSSAVVSHVPDVNGLPREQRDGGDGEADA
jgi:hypothetical protein